MFVQEEKEVVLMRPVVKIPKNIEFPFCIIRRKELEEIMTEFMKTGSVR